jgi:hypothetical protein
MALVKDDKGGPAPPDRPQTLLDLLVDLSRDPELRSGFTQLIFALALAACLPIWVGIDASATAARGLNGLALSHLIPTGLFAGTPITYLIIKARKKFTNQNRGAIPGGKPTKENSPDLIRKKNRPGRKQKQLLRTRRQSSPRRWWPGLPLLLP